VLVQEICNELGVIIIAIECDKDYIHLFLNTLSTLSAAGNQKIKG
jgi:putative transposase